MKTIKGFLSATLVTGMALCSFMPKTNLIAAELPDKSHDVSETFGTGRTALSDTLFLSVMALRKTKQSLMLL